MTAETMSLGEALPLEVARVGDKVLPVYVAVGPPGAFAVAMIRADLDAASRAMIAGDRIEMIRLYQVLKETHT